VYDEVWVLVEVRVAEVLIVTVGAVGVTDPVFEIDGDGVDVFVLVKVGVRVAVPVRIVGWAKAGELEMAVGVMGNMKGLGDGVLVSVGKRKGVFVEDSDGAEVGDSGILSISRLWFVDKTLTDEFKINSCVDVAAAM
jgi:hypothetical protein